MTVTLFLEVYLNSGTESAVNLSDTDLNDACNNIIWTRTHKYPRRSPMIFGYDARPRGFLDNSAVNLFDSDSKDACDAGAGANTNTTRHA
jgi:hypothetical protein